MRKEEKIDISYFKTIKSKNGETKLKYQYLAYSNYKRYRAHIKQCAIAFFDEIGCKAEFFKKDANKNWKFNKQDFLKSREYEILLGRLRNFAFNVIKTNPNKKTTLKPITFLKEYAKGEKIETKDFCIYKSKDDIGKQYKRFMGKQKTVQVAKVNLLKKLEDENIINSDQIPCALCFNIVHIVKSITIEHVQPKANIYMRMAAILYLMNKLDTLREVIFGNEEFKYCIIVAAVQRPDKKELYNFKESTLTFNDNKTKKIYYPSKFFKKTLFRDRRNLCLTCKSCNETKKDKPLVEMIHEMKSNPDNPYHTAISHLSEVQTTFDQNNIFSMMEDGRLAGEWLMMLYIQTAKDRLENDREIAKLMLHINCSKYPTQIIRQINEVLEKYEAQGSNQIQAQLDPAQSNKAGPATLLPSPSGA